MATVYPLKRVANRAHNSSIPDSDTIISRSIRADPAGAGGVADLWGSADAKTTAISIATGSAVTTITIGGGAASTSMTVGRSGQLATFLGDLKVNGSLQVNGTVTTVNATSITTQDQVLTIALTSRATAAANAVYAVYRGNASGGGVDALMYWNEASTRFDLGFGDTGVAGGTLPGAPVSWADVKLKNLTLAGTTLTADAGLTISATSAALTLQTTSTGAINLTSAGAIVGTSSGTSSWNNTSGNITIQTTTSGNIALTSAGSLSTSSATTSSLSATSTMTITGTTALNLTASGASDITFTGRGQAYTFNQASDTAFSPGITATSIIGAINQAYASAGMASGVGIAWTNNDGTNAIARGSPVYIIAASKVANATAASDNSAAQMIGFANVQISAAGTGTVLVDGVVSMLFKSGDTVPSIGAEIFLKESAPTTASLITSSWVTGTAPSTTGNVVLSVGFLKDDLGTSSPFAADTLLPVQIVRGAKSVV